jgi:hypothetical protein
MLNGQKYFFLRELPEMATLGPFRKLPGIMVAMESGDPPKVKWPNHYFFYQGTPWYHSGHGKGPSLRIKAKKYFGSWNFLENNWP